MVRRLTAVYSMFFRVLLLSYFALGAAWGPAFCCCRVRSLVEYCTRQSPAVELAASNESSGNSTSCPRCRAAAEQKQRELAGGISCCSDTSSQRRPDSECPCRQRGEVEFGLSGVVLLGLVNAASGDQCPGELLCYSISAGFDTTAGFSSRLRFWTQFPEKETLFGRALLRAYQTLNC